jgi:phenylpyruvate tautomerase PptA (4-oxalocrotonate tautomerase family)
MPVYTCTTTIGTLDEPTKRDLAAEITRIHAERLVAEGAHGSRPSCCRRPRAT